MKQVSLALLMLSLTAVSAFAQKQQSDREFQGFKGAVKSVTIERAKLTKSGDTTVEAARQPYKMHTFDTDGNLILDKAYDHRGEEFDLRTYSYVDGERVVKHDVLSKNVIVGTSKKPGPDERRYSAKIKYKYDSQGRRIEKAWLHPDGRPALRYVYKLEGNRKEVSVYRDDNSFSHGYVDTVDDKGNEVESTDVLPNRPSGVKTKYTYLEFDSQGNWTKRTESRGDSSWMTYRAITFY